jgi:hypothetical protein
MINAIQRYSRSSATPLRPAVLVPAVLCLLLFTRSSLARLADYPTPSWLHFNTIAENMVINGLTSEVYYFISESSSEKTLKFYRNKWQSHPDYTPGYKESWVAPWHILARTESDKLITLQIQDDSENSSLGYFTIADLASSKTKKRADVPMPSGSRILNQSLSEDGDKTSSVTLVSNTASISSNTDFYLDYFLGEGWTNDVHQEENDSVTLSFRKDRQEAYLIIRQLFGATQIVINKVKQ